MIKVRPIKDAQLLKEIQDDLSTLTSVRGRRAYLLFEMGIYTGLRIGDLVGLRVKHVSGTKLFLIEEKTEKQTEISINETLRVVLDNELAGRDDNDFLFPSPRDPLKHITTRTAENDMAWVKERYKISFPFSCHSLRKTFGYRYYLQSGGDIEGLRMRFNHATTEVTRRYICIEQDEVNRISDTMYMGHRPERREPSRRHEARPEPVSIRTRDNTKQGKAWGEAMRKKGHAKKAAEKSVDV